MSQSPVAAQTFARRVGQRRADRFRPLGADVLLLVAAAVAATCNFSTTSAPYNMAAIAIAAVTAPYALTRMTISPPRPATMLAACLITLVPQTIRPPTGNVHRTGFFGWSVGLGVVAVLALAASLLAGVRLARPSVAGWLAVGSAAATAVATLFAIPGGAHPAIDVWDIFQQSAAGLFHGVNPYEITHFSVPPGQTANCFNYLPVSFLASWLGWVSFADVRYAEVVVLLAGWTSLTAALIARASPDRRGVAAPVGLMLVAATLAGTLRVAQQAWNESLVLGFLLIAAALVIHGRGRWAWLPIALALATKQHVALLLPLFAVWPCLGPRRTAYSVFGAVAVSGPWVVWNPSRFSSCTVRFFLDLDERHDSISFWRYLPPATRSAAVALSLAIAFTLVLRHMPRTPGGLLLASATVMLGFDLFNKQTFENQWWLVAQLIVSGLAVRVGESPPALAAQSALNPTGEGR